MAFKFLRKRSRSKKFGTSHLDDNKTRTLLHFDNA